jgi:hypothetical protein
MSDPRRALTLLALGSVLALTLASPTAARADAADEPDLLLLDGGLAQVTLTGLLQLQATPLLGADARLVNGDPADSAGFRLARGRFGIRATAWGDTEVALGVQANARGLNLLDAWVAWRRHAVATIVAGTRIVPFSRFAQLDAHRGTFVELPLATRALAPFRQTGVSLEGDLGGGLLHYAVGAWNGLRRAPNFGEGYVQDSALEGNRFTRLSYLGRLEVAPLGALGGGLVDFDGGGLRVGVGASLLHDPGKTVESTAWAVDFALKFQGFHAAAEFVVDDARPTEDPTTPPEVPVSLSRQAFVAEAGYLLVGDSLGATARLELLDDNTSLANTGDVLVVAGGLQAYLHRHHLKAQLEYTHRRERHGVQLANDALLLQLQMAL